MSTLQHKAKQLIHDRQQEFETAPLSRCIEIALEDMEAAKKDGVEIDMHIWAVQYGNTCYACFAGCVMLQRFLTTPQIAPVPYGDANPLYDLDRVAPGTSIAVRNRFHALNQVRQGAITEALEEMSGCFSSGDPEWGEDVPNNTGPEFVAAMREIAKKLRVRGF